MNLKYRTKEEVEHWKTRCPVNNFRNYLIESSIISEKELNEIDVSLKNVLNEAVEFATNSRLPLPEDALKEMYATEYEGIPHKGWD